MIYLGLFNLKTEESLLILVVPIIFFSLILVLFLVIPSTYSKLDTEEATHAIIRNNLLYSRNCLAYENGNVIPGLVDINKFNPDRLQKCLGLKGDTYGVLLDLEYGENKKNIEINEVMSDRVNFCLSKGSFECSDEKVYVLVNENGESISGVLDIIIVGFKK